MKTYWCLRSYFYDDGTVKTAIVNRVCREKPENSCEYLSYADCYLDWYNTFAAAVMAEEKYRELSAEMALEKKGG